MKSRLDYKKALLKAQKLLGDGILIFDAKEKNIPLVFINKGVKKILGFSSKELIGKSYRFLESKGNDKENLFKVRSIFKTEYNVTVDLFLQRKNNKKVLCRVAITPVPDNKGKLDYIICVMRDITEAREKLLNKIKLSVVESTLNTVNDIVFNYLHIIQYYRGEFEKHCDVVRLNLKDFDKSYTSTLNKLKRINEMKEYKERKINTELTILNYS